MSWIQLAESRIVQRSFVNKVMNRQVPYKTLSSELLSVSREFFFNQLVHLVTPDSPIQWTLKSKLSPNLHY